jgi:hypothetical protein
MQQFQEIIIHSVRNTDISIWVLVLAVGTFLLKVEECNVIEMSRELNVCALQNTTIYYNLL